jgi:glycosyltransferase involved in cell wall biosynthesis
MPVAQVRRLLYLRRHIAQSAPDLVHTYFFWSIIYGRILKRLGAIRLLVENREDMGFSWGTNEYRFLRLTASLPDRVICVAEAVREVVVAKERIDPARTLVVRNGVQPLRTVSKERSAIREELGIAKDVLVIGMVANLNRPVKGVSHFLDAIPLIARAVPTARFLIVGRASNEKALWAQARALGVDNCLTLAGYRSDVSKCYAAMDVSVLTSLTEGLSLTILESMNHGLPVVVTRVGGNPEVVTNAETGFLVPPGDVRSFAEHVIDLLKNPDLRARMGRQARRRIEREFDIRDVRARYLRVYRDLLLAGPMIP